MTVGFCLSSIKPAADYIGKFSIRVPPELLPPIRFIHVFNINESEPVKEQLKVIREDMLYTLNEVY